MLYGRDAERSRIAALLDGARSGRSGVLVLRGEAGVGKSALLQSAREHAAGMSVIGGCGIESEAQLPYAGLHQIIRPVLDQVGRLPNPQARALRGALGLEPGAGDEWFLVSLAVLSLLAEAAHDRPLLCLVDDAHWLDDASAGSLVFAARRLEAEGVVMVFAAREGEMRTFDAPGLPELRLEGLDVEAAGALLDAHVEAALSPEMRERLITGTGGNPLALIELSSTLGEPQLAGGEPLLEPLPVGARIERAFAARVARLPQDAQILILVAAAEETGSLATILAAGARLGVGVEALDASEQARLIRVGASRLEFRHPLIRSAVYQAAPFSRRQAAHRALAAVLEGESEADRRAWHRAVATVEPDASVAEELERAAERARRRSGLVASSLAFERAAALSTDEHRAVRLLINAVEDAWFAGRLERAQALLRRVRPLAANPIERAEIDRWQGLIEVNVGTPGVGCELLVRAASDMAATEHEAALYLLTIACVAASYAGEVGRVALIADRAAAIPDDDTPVARFLSHFLSGAGSHLTGAFEQGAPHLRAAVELADDADVAGSGAFRALLLFGGAAAMFLGDDAAADRLHRRLVMRARDAGMLALLTQLLPRAALPQIAAGRWSEATSGVRDGVELARQTGQHQVVAHMLSTLALLAGLRGDEGECRSLAAESRELAEARGLVHVTQTARWALLVLELGRGVPEDALMCARQITELPFTLWAAPERIEAAVRAGDSRTAGAWLAELERWATASGAAWAHAVALRLRALLSEDEEETAHLFEAALQAHRDAGRPLDRARTELAYGEFLRRGRHRIAAREHLRAALDAFENLGAALWADRAGVELRASGQTARRRGPSTRDALTAQELQIAQYVGQGLSNREVAAQLFLSPRTIDFHLRNVFRKLGLTSRVQLAQLELHGDGDAVATPREPTPPTPA